LGLSWVKREAQVDVDVVVFDVGETLVNEDRAWCSWASWLGVAPSVLFACLGATIARREDHRKAFDLLDDRFDFAAQDKAKELAGHGWLLGVEDLYPDALRCLARLSSAGYRVGIAGNQPAAVERALVAADLPVAFIASSETLGVSKPSPVFFERVVELAGVPAERAAYVGDRADNDVLPAHQAGMTSVFIRRGPWGYIQATWPEIVYADLVVSSLDELVEVLAVNGP
jgi:HAD superfamily hydrolase (TIGR01509 family)